MIKSFIYIYIYIIQQNRNPEEEDQVIDFFLYEYQEKCDFDILNSSLFKSVFDLIRINENTKNFFIIYLFEIPFLLFLLFFLFSKNNEKSKIIRKYSKINKQLENQLSTLNKQNLF